MALNKGDKVVYIRNDAYDDNDRLLKRPIGTIKKFAYGHILCEWDAITEIFYWSVPANYIKLYRENK